MNNHIFSAMVDKYNNLVVVISTSQGGSVKLVLEKGMTVHTGIGDDRFDIKMVKEDEA